LSISNNNLEELRDRLRHIREKREISDRELNYFAMSNVEGVFTGTLDWITDEATNLERQIDSIRGFCKDNISASLLDEFMREISEIRREIDQRVTGVLSQRPSDDIMRDYPRYIDEMLRRIQILIPLLSNLYRMRARLDSACDSILQPSRNAI